MLIEEAAGVTKYKSRRRAAELKLEAAQGNLTRVDDIIFEAPTKASQAWFVRKFGPEVNLGNIPPDEVIPLETLRLGLRADTLKEVLLGDQPAPVAD